MIKKKLFAVLILLAILFSGAAYSATKFNLISIKDKRQTGPYTLYNGSQVRIDGLLYELRIKDGRITFTDISSKAVYGPFQLVEGRIMRIGTTAYALTTKNIANNEETQPEDPQKKEVEKPIAEFEPLPPRPEMIPIPKENARRSVAPLDLPKLPDATKPFSLALWLSPLNKNTVDWSVETLHGMKADIERVSFGTLLSLNSYLLDFEYTPSLEGGSILPYGVEIANSRIDDGSGYSLSLGYKRPFIKEGRWTAQAGVYGRYRKDELNINTTSLVPTGVADTNELGNVYSVYKTDVSTVKITELTLGIDLELSFSEDHFGGYANVLIQPISEMKTSGALVSNNKELSVSAAHETPLAFKFGGWFKIEKDWKIFGEVIVGFEDIFRLGLTRSF